MPIKVISTIQEKESQEVVTEVTIEMIESKIDLLNEITSKTLDEALEIDELITLGSTVIDYMCEGMGSRGYVEFIKRYNTFILLKIKTNWSDYKCQYCI
jgi:hypothetical protein